jgi:DNA-binding MarR family transcriptional regulator
MDFTDLSSTKVRVVPAPGAGLLSLVLDELGGRDRGALPEWRAALRHNLPTTQSAEIITPLVTPGQSIVPDCVVPVDSHSDLRVNEHIERLRELPGDELRAELGEIFADGMLPATWRPVIETPERWLNSFAAVLEHAWRAYSPLWQSARRLVAREYERIGAAVVSGNLDLVLSGLTRHTRVRSQQLLFPDVQPGTCTLAERDLVLMPMVAGADALIVNCDDPYEVWMSYPVPGAAMLTADATTLRDEHELTALLGEARARVLTALDVTRSTGEIASMLGFAPSTVTYHCDKLSDAGLITRERRNHEMRVRRSPRGESLLSLYRASDTRLPPAAGQDRRVLRHASRTFWLLSSCRHRPLRGAATRDGTYRCCQLSAASARR